MGRTVRAKVFILISVVLLVFSCMSAHAQYKDMPLTSGGKQIELKGAYFYDGDERLCPAQLAGFLAHTDFTSDQVEKYQKGFNAGKSLLIGFGSLTGAGLITTGVGVIGVMVEAIAVGVGTAFLAPLFVFAGSEPSSDMQFESKFIYVTYAGLAAAGVGILGLAAGTTVYCVYKKRLNRVEDALNSRPVDIQVSVGAQKHGVGLAVNF